MHGEVVPLAVEQDAAEVKHPLGSASAPAHPGAVETHADEVADRAFDGAGADVEVVAAERMVRHPMAMLAEVCEYIENLLALGLVARAGLGDGGVGGRQRRDYLAGTAPATQIADAVGDPRGELAGSFSVPRSSPWRWTTVPSRTSSNG